MSKNLYALALVVLSAGMAFGECPAGYQAGRVLKAFDQDLSSAARPIEPQADGQSQQHHSVTTVRILIFIGSPDSSEAGAGAVPSGKRYELRMRLVTKDQALMPAQGQRVCFRKDGGNIHVLTDQGKPLPGVALPLPTLPRR